MEIKIQKQHNSIDPFNISINLENECKGDECPPGSNQYCPFGDTCLMDGELLTCSPSDTCPSGTHLASCLIPTRGVTNCIPNNCFYNLATCTAICS